MSRDKDGSPRVVNTQPPIQNQAIVDALVKVQPYSRPHGPADCALAILNDLCNIDKHRLLLTIVNSIDRDNLGWWGSNEGDPKPTFNYTLGPLRAGDAVATFDFGGRRAPAHFDPHISLAVSLNEPVANWVNFYDAAEGLSRLRGNVGLDININFLPFFNEPWLT